MSAVVCPGAFLGTTHPIFVKALPCYEAFGDNPDRFILDIKYNDYEIEFPDLILGNIAGIVLPGDGLTPDVGIIKPIGIIVREDGVKIIYSGRHHVVSISCAVSKYRLKAIVESSTTCTTNRTSSRTAQRELIETLTLQNKERMCNDCHALWKRLCRVTAVSNASEKCRAREIECDQEMSAKKAKLVYDAHYRSLKKIEEIAKDQNSSISSNRYSKNAICNSSKYILIFLLYYFSLF